MLPTTIPKKLHRQTDRHVQSTCTQENIFLEFQEETNLGGGVYSTHTHMHIHPPQTKQKQNKRDSACVFYDKMHIYQCILYIYGLVDRGHAQVSGNSMPRAVAVATPPVCSHMSPLTWGRRRGALGTTGTMRHTMVPPCPQRQLPFLIDCWAAAVSD